eukprot:358445-Chlamydomonas_euryale.AAC.21
MRLRGAGSTTTIHFKQQLVIVTCSIWSTVRPGPPAHRTIARSLPPLVLVTAAAVGCGWQACILGHLQQRRIGDAGAVC